MKPDELHDVVKFRPSDVPNGRAKAGPVAIGHGWGLRVRRKWEQFTLCPWVRVRQLLADKARTEGEKAASLAYFARAAHPHRAGL